MYRRTTLRPADRRPQAAQNRTHTTSQTQLETTAVDSRMKMNGGVLLVQYLLAVLCISLSVGEPLTTLCFHIIHTRIHIIIPVGRLERVLSVTSLERVPAGSCLHQWCAYVVSLYTTLYSVCVYGTHVAVVCTCTTSSGCVVCKQGTLSGQTTCS